MRWGQIHQGMSMDSMGDPVAAVFQGETHNTILTLIGSSQHVIGNQKLGKSPLQASWSIDSINGLLYALRKDEELVDSSDKQKDAKDRISITDERKLVGITELASHIWPKQRLEFLARTILGPLKSEQGILLLGSPVYVALA